MTGVIPATKKVHKKKLNIKNFLILLLIIAILTIGIYSYLKMPLKRIIITGNNNIKDVDIIRQCDLIDYPKFSSISKKDIINKISSLDLIDQVKVRKNIWGYLYIDIKEAEILFFNKNNNKIILSNGKSTNNQNYMGIPTLINYVPEDIYKELIEKLVKVDIDIRSIISEIEYSPSKNAEGDTIDDTRFILRMNDGNTVYMNTINIEQLNNYIDIFSTTNISDKKGILYLDSKTGNLVFQTYEAYEKEQQELLDKEKDDQEDET